MEEEVRTLQSRYGYSRAITREEPISDVIDWLFADLDSREHGKDKEHAQISVRVGRWSLTVNTSGLMTLSDCIDFEVPERYFRPTSREEVRTYLESMLSANQDVVMSLPWVEYAEIPKQKGKDLFRG